MNAVSQRIGGIAEVQEFISQQITRPGQPLVIFDMDLALTMPHLPALIYLTILEHHAKLQQFLHPFTNLEKRKICTLAL